MSQSYSYLIPKLKQVEQAGIMVDRYEHAFPASVCGRERILPNYYLLLTHQGSTRVMYDMQEATLTPNTAVLVMPGHLIRFIDRTDDLVFSRLVIKPELFDEMLCLAFSHDVQKYHSHPAYILTDEQVGNMMKIMELLEIIAKHDEKEVPHRHQLLLTQMVVGYEFLNYYRSEQDKKQTDSSKAELLNRFCDLVVKHFRESREVKFYAEKLHFHPYYLTRAIREASGGISPVEWIEQYVITLAKKMIETSPDQPLTRIAYALGFTEPTSFYRYFKHATGITANEYRDRLKKERD
jgi:AraC-like DNA-binding protein